MAKSRRTYCNGHETDGTLGGMSGSAVGIFLLGLVESSDSLMRGDTVGLANASD